MLSATAVKLPGNKVPVHVRSECAKVSLEPDCGRSSKCKRKRNCNCCINEENTVLQATNLNTPEVKCLKYLYGGNG